MSQRIGRVSYQTIYQWENDINDPALSSLREWAGALGFDVAIVPADVHHDTSGGEG